MNMAVVFDKLRRRRYLAISVLLLCCLLGFACKEKRSPNTVYRNIEPDYRLVQVRVSNDTIHFPLNESTYNSIKSFNIFLSKGIEYISFYDRRSESVNIYNFRDRSLAAKIQLKQLIKEKFYKTSVFVKEFDSIYITNQTTLYHFDSAGNKLKSVKFLDKPTFCWAYFENTNPPVFDNNHIYMGVRMFVDETSLSAMKDWRLIYKFDMKNGTAELYQHLPEFYQNNYFGHRFLDFGYCFNDRKNFVFSFGADSTIYETDLKELQISYFAKSQFQQENIHPVSKTALVNDEGSKEYAIRDSYGAIYFDATKRRYLRVAKSKMTESDYHAKKRSKSQRFIVFNSNMKIIGESPIDSTLSLSTFFFAADGSMYTRANPKDEYSLHFVRLVYDETGPEEIQFAKNKDQE